MRRFQKLAGSLAVLAGLAVGCERGPTVPPATAPSLGEASGVDRYIVVVRDDVDPRAVAASYGLTAQFVYEYALKGFSAVIADAARANLEQNPLVRWVEPVKEFCVFAEGGCVQHHRPGHDRGGRKPPRPAPLECVQGPGDPNTHDDLADLWGIRRVNAPQSSEWINEPVEVDIAILDTGADLKHPDLCVHRARSFDPFEGTPDDGNGHGTHVSGTAAARDDNGIVVGVSPEARIWVVKVCNTFGICFNDAIVAGVDFVTQNAGEIDVANMSLGGGGSDQPHAPNDCEAITGDAMHTAICKSVRAGVTYVVAAGNGSSDASGTVPAAYDEVITVSALNESDQAAGFSNFGPDVDLIAPGVNILSDWPGGGTNRLSGTSMASPHVAGGAGLYIAKQMNAGNPRPDPFKVRDVLVANGQAWAGQGGNHPEPLLDVKNF